MTQEDVHDAGEVEESGRRIPWRLLLLATALGSALFLAHVFDLGGRLGDLRDWIRSLGPMGPFAFAGIYIGATVAALPGAPLTLAAGAVFGSVLGILVVSIASTLGAGASFLIARYAARGTVERWLAGSKRFKRLDDLTETQGALIVAVTRLVPLFPFNILNYAFGLTRMRFRTYLFWSWVCMLPATILYVVGADAVFEAVHSGRVPWDLLAILAAAFVVLMLMARLARRRLKECEEGMIPELDNCVEPLNKKENSPHDRSG